MFLCRLREFRWAQSCSQKYAGPQVQLDDKNVIRPTTDSEKSRIHMKSRIHSSIRMDERERSCLVHKTVSHSILNSFDRTSPREHDSDQQDCQFPVTILIFR